MYKVTLTAARVNANFTLEQVARKIDKSKNTIISWEKGKTAIDVYNLDQLCILYNVPMECISLPLYSTKSVKDEREIDE